MKHRKTTLLLVLSLTLLLGGCAAPASGGPADPQAALDGICDRLSPLLPEMIALEPETILDYYGIEPGDYTACAVYISADSMLADEAALFYAADEAAAERIEAFLTARLDQKAEEAQGYSPEQYAVIRGCSPLREGQAVALLVNADFEAVKGIFMEGIA